MGVSQNKGTPKSSIHRWIFHSKPSILGIPASGRSVVDHWLEIHLGLSDLHMDLRSATGKIPDHVIDMSRFRDFSYTVFKKKVGIIVHMVSFPTI